MLVDLKLNHLDMKMQKVAFVIDQAYYVTLRGVSAPVRYPDLGIYVDLI